MLAPAPVLPVLEIRFPVGTSARVGWSVKVGAT